MTLYKEWKELLENQTDKTFEDFWTEYSQTETRIYEGILGDFIAQRKGSDLSGAGLSGSFRELAEKYQADPVIFTGFLDGINESLNNEMDVEKVTASSSIQLDIDLEKLYFNMLAAGAKYLYTLPQWDDILSDEKRTEITKNYKRSKTVVKAKKIGRNDPCPCGSGKKYKYCCGRNK